MGKLIDDKPVKPSPASLSYLFITHGSYEGEKATPKEARAIRKHLERYCGQDTEGMVHILEKLKGFVAPKSQD